MTSSFKHQFTEHKRPPRAALLFVLLALVLVTAGIPMIAHAQLNSNIARVNLNAILNTSLTVSAAPGLVNFALVRSGVANGSSAINITTSWSLPVRYTTVQEYAYFTSTVAALTDGAADNIPSAKVSGSPNGGAFAPFTGNSPFAAGSSLLIFSTDPAGGNNQNNGGNNTQTRTDTLSLRIDTTGLNLPAGTYSGTLNIRAQAF